MKYTLKITLLPSFQVLGYSSSSENKLAVLVKRLKMKKILSRSKMMIYYLKDSWPHRELGQSQSTKQINLVSGHDWVLTIFPFGSMSLVSMQNKELVFPLGPEVCTVSSWITNPTVQSDTLARADINSSSLQEISQLFGMFVNEFLQSWFCSFSIPGCWDKS